MDLQKKIKKQFLKYKTIIIKQVGQKALYNDTIDKICKGLFKSKYIGTYTQDKIPDNLYNDTRYMIINVDKYGEDGSHWVSIAIQHNKYFIWDSFGRDLSKLLKILTKKLKNKQVEIINGNEDGANQKGYSEVCGQMCISWLICFDKYGQDALLI